MRNKMLKLSLLLSVLLMACSSDDVPPEQQAYQQQSQFSPAQYQQPAPPAPVVVQAPQQNSSISDVILPGLVGYMMGNHSNQTNNVVRETVVVKQVQPVGQRISIPELKPAPSVTPSVPLTTVTSQTNKVTPILRTPPPTPVKTIPKTNTYPSSLSRNRTFPTSSFRPIVRSAK